MKNIHITEVPTTSTRACMMNLLRQVSFKSYNSKTLGYWVERLVDGPFVDTGQRMCSEVTFETMPAWLLSRLQARMQVPIDSQI